MRFSPALIVKHKEIIKEAADLVSPPFVDIAVLFPGSSYIRQRL